MVHSKPNSVKVGQPISNEESKKPTIRYKLPPMYNIKSSQRLTDRLVNPYQRDITATVGTYDPRPDSETKKTGKGTWAKMSGRVEQKQFQTHLGPGFYAVKETGSSAVTAPFTSQTRRFKYLCPSHIAPGSYEVNPIHISRGWKPWVVHVSGRLGRIMEKQEADTLTGTVSQVLEQLSIDIPRVVFQESKNKLKKDQEKPKDETSKKTMNYESKSTTINPYNASFFVQSITIPEK